MARIPGLALVALAATLAAVAPAAAQQYPTRPVKIIVAFTAGGTTDIMARTLAPRLSERFKQPFIIENRPGAGGNLGTEMAVRAAPDGYTILVNTVGPMAVNPSLYKNLPYNPLTDLVPIAQISDVPNVLVVHPALKVTTMDAFIAYAKAHSGELNYGSTGIGTSSHLSSFVLASRAGFNATHIPYKGAEVLKDLLSGRLQFMFATIPSVIAHIKAGNLVAIAVSSTKRSRSLPDVPPVAESGFPGFEAGSWVGIFAPRGTPPEVIAALNKAAVEAMKDKAVIDKLSVQGATLVGNSPDEFRAFIDSETKKWAKVIKDAGVPVQK